jgi:hypothetical protein
MSYPAMQSILVRGALQNISVLYRNASYIADSIFPLINGLNYQTKVMKYGKQPWFAQTEDGYRAENSVAKRVDLKVSTQNMDPREIAFGGVVSDELFFASNQPGNLPIQPISDTILLISDKIDRFREQLVAQTVFGTSDKYPGIAWADGTTGGSAPTAGNGGWALDTSANSVLTDIENAKVTIQQQTGVMPNTLMLSRPTFQALKIHATANGGVIDRLKYTQTAGPAQITEGLLASMFGLDNVIIGDAIQSTGNENAAGTITAANTSYIWDPNKTGTAFLYYRPAAAGLKQISPGYQYRVAYDGATWRRMISYREEWSHHSVYEVSEWVDIVPVSTDVGYLWSRTIA